MASTKRAAAALTTAARSTTTYKVFASCIPKFQSLLADELKSLGISRVQPAFIERYSADATATATATAPAPAAAATTAAGKFTRNATVSAANRGSGSDALPPPPSARVQSTLRLVPAGGVEFSVSQRELWRVSHQSRLADSFRIRIGTVRNIQNWGDLRTSVLKLPWHAYFRRAGECPRVSASSAKSTLYHTAGIAERIAHTLVRHMDLRPNPKATLATAAAAYDSFDATLPDNAKIDSSLAAARASASASASDPNAEESSAGSGDGGGGRDSFAHVFARLESNEVTYSVNVSGDSLHRRGYKQWTSTTPVRETIAAALIRMAMNAVFGAERVNLPPLIPTAATATAATSGGASSGTAATTADGRRVAIRYDPAMPRAPQLIRHFWDPFAGSGTAVIESFDANYRVLRTLPRTFAFEEWPLHDDSRYKRVLRQMMAHDVTVPADVSFIGSDVDPHAIAAAKHNAAAAGVDRFVQFETGDFDKIVDRIPRGAFILTNIPYAVPAGSGSGSSSGDPDARSRLYERFGRMLMRRADLAHVFVLCGTGAGFVPRSGLVWRSLVTFPHGGLPVELLQLDRSATKLRSEWRRNERTAASATGSASGPFTRAAANVRAATDPQSAFRNKLRSAEDTAAPPASVDSGSARV